MKIREDHYIIEKSYPFANSIKDKILDQINNFSFIRDMYNIDGGSKYYGKAINSRLELKWQRRTYDLSLFYNPYKAMGGFAIRLHDFSFDGTGIPFLQSDYYTRKNLVIK